MLYTKLFIFGILICTGLFAEPIYAESLPSQLSIDRGADSSDGKDYFLALDLGWEKIHLGLGYGESESQQDGINLDTETRELRIGSDPVGDYAVELSYAEWGQQQEIEIQTWRIDFILNTDNWRFTLAPQTRNIEIFWSDKSRTPIELDSDGINLGIAFYGADPWYISIDYTRHDYSRDISYLASDTILAAILLSRLSSATRNYTFGLEDEQISGDLGYAFEQLTLGIAGSRSISVVDESVSTSRSIYLSYRFDDHWQLNLEGGRSELSLSNEETRFGVAGLSYRW